ncbi:MAG: histidine triad (HIT) family protein [Paracoccaceae bacterium]|jgi:histidine triad (HIT) family protein
MHYSYDSTNIFACILRGEIPNKTILETDHSLAFHDINPAAPVHILLIPKGTYVTCDDFAARASVEELMDFNRSLAKVVDLMELSAGYRAITNSGADGLQEVPHYHLHILGGRSMGPMLTKA